MTAAAGAPADRPEADLWCVVHVIPGVHALPLTTVIVETVGMPIQLTGPFYRWDLAVEWAARTFDDERQAEVLPFQLLAPEFEDEAAALGEVEPTAWVLCHRDDPTRALVAAIGPFVNRHIAYADCVVHPLRYLDHLVVMAEFGMLQDDRLTGRDQV